MKYHRSIWAVFALIFLWYLASVSIQNDFLMPGPLQVMQRMASLVTSQTFYVSILSTIARVFIGLLIAFLCASIMSFMSYRSGFFKDMCYPLLLLTRSVPNVCYIIIVQLWFGRELSSGIITFLILFPMIYANLYEGLCHLPKSLQNAVKLYPTTLMDSILHIYIPLLKAPILSSFSTALSLGFKVGVMSEILGQVQVGIGRQLNVCRLSFDMVGVFAWTGWIVVLLLLIELFFYKVYQQRREDTSV